MKRVLLAISVSVILLANGVAANQLGVFGAYWDAKDADEPFGWGATLRMAVDRTTTMELSGALFKFDETNVRGVTDLEVIPLEIGFLYRLSEDRSSSLYAGGGIGYYMMDGKYARSGETVNLDVDNRLGYYATGGLSLKVTPAVHVFGEVRYTWVRLKSGKATVGGEREDIELDSKLDGLGARVGLMFRW